MEIINVRLKDIHMDEDFNCRGTIVPLDVVDLVKDIEQHGLIQPILVQEYDEAKKLETGCKYRLLAGFRRTTAHKVLVKNDIKWNIIAAVLHTPVSESEAYILNLSENIQRKDLTILQEARAVAKLEQLGVTESDCAYKLGMSRGWVQLRYMLLRLPSEVQEEVAAGFINQTQIRELYSIYKTAGKESCFNATRQLKDAKIKGRKNATVNPNKKNKDAKRQRKRGEIQEMLEHIFDAVGSGFHARCLAWASGEISDNELYMSIKAFAIKEGKNYSIPGA